MRKATAEWLKSAELDLKNVAQIIDYGKPTVADAQEFFKTAQTIYAQIEREFAVGGDDRPR